MPKITKKLGGRPRVFDARPDRADLRDREYRPPLVSLPQRWPSAEDVATWFPAYAKAHMVGNQGDEGSCTGWALRSVINYLLWCDANLQNGPKAVKVSWRMLYHLARIYDEWDGEDYEGSSCRGAMKGWHRHGVCTEALWPCEPGVFHPPAPEWEDDAAQRPLGAYYRIEKGRINDLQAAIHEVGAVYVSADVHAGWGKVYAKPGKPYDAPPLIPMATKADGGHAFCLVGYTEDGFVVQNSWDTDWGWNGFAVLSYADWVANGMDAWVAVLGAPTRVTERRGTLADRSLQARAGDRAEWFGLLGKGGDEYHYEQKAVEPYSRSRALERSIVIGNEGRPLRRLVEHEDAAAGLARVALELPREWLAAPRDVPPKLCIYAHGGLNSEDAGLRRAQILGPYFEANRVYPLFLVWRTGLVETLGSILSDFADAVIPWKAGSWLGDAVDWVAERKDRSVEFASRTAVKPIWTEMKENAGLAATQGGATRLLAGHLATLRDEFPELEIHLIGHSAGSIILGHLLDLLGGKGLAVTSLHLFAPACTTEFALSHYAPQLAADGVLAKSLLRIHDLGDARELGDSVGPYGKSLLYLVSRALEPRHKTPLLGLAKAWNRVPRRSTEWDDAGREQVNAWIAGWGDRKGLVVHDEKTVSDGRGDIPIAHGTFDNDVKLITATIRAVRRKPLQFRVENLRGY